MRRFRRSWALWGLLAFAGAACGGAALVYSGLYDVSATRQHGSAVFWLLNTVRSRSVRTHSAAVQVPPDFATERSVAAGLGLYEQHCATCHGAPGVAPGPTGLGLNPEPPNLAQMGQELSAREIYWAVSNGIKMSGMPAWRHRLSERERWALTAFLTTSSQLSPAEYRAQRDRLVGAGPVHLPSEPEAPGDQAGAVDRGRAAVQQYACTTCHVIPGATGPDTKVGPPLGGISNRTFLAGILPNNRSNMMQWLRWPQELKPLCAMPDLGVSENDASDIAAFLSTLR